MLLLGSAGWRRVVCAWIAAVAFASLPCAAREAMFATVSVGTLPMEARTTLARIHEGGPFPYPRDGVIFNNRERILPTKPYGYYHEYTVPTPQARTRGARRIVCGGAVATLSECYYSDDHYQSFRKIQP
jgi:ribonuclease T1